MPDEYDNISAVLGIPDEIIKRLPEHGLIVYSFSRYDLNGTTFVDLENQFVDFEVSIPREDSNKKGRIELASDVLARVEKLFGAIWDSENDFQGPMPARVMHTQMVLARAGTYRQWHLPGMFSGEVEELHELLIQLISSN